ncbi:WhiB family transcriptional regulator [Kribbella sp. NPDC050470]|uniref:WhiB family transcriptional regulator n=1 Tax=unclassified Kribbella TaxID=2644121 RepID=UPI00378C66F4
MRDAACREIGTLAFYLEPGAAHEDWDYLRNVCKTRCPVLQECRDRVMRMELGECYKTRFGVSAGMSPLERKKYEPQWLAEQEPAA